MVAAICTQPTPLLHPPPPPQKNLLPPSDYEYAALRKKLLITPFVERFKTTNLESLNCRFYQYFKQFA